VTWGGGEVFEQQAGFDLAAVEAGVAETEFAGAVVHLPTVGSTNDLALNAARGGAERGVWIADEQTAGRGRGTHAWHSAAGDGLYLTALTRAAMPMQTTLGLAFRTAIAVQGAISEVTGLARPREIDIRWPNDLVIPQAAGPAKKVSGILIETAADAGAREAKLKYAVIGIGVNVNHRHFPPELDGIATSLRREIAGQPAIAREALAAAILRRLDAEIRRLGRGEVTDWLELERQSTWVRGKRVRVEGREGEPGYTGVTAGFDPQGFLLVEADTGEMHTIFSGGLRDV
jgi:BirA family biotin operon repressor/biotin-[acetyl-CoA-carboxylase] ligase